MFLCFQGHCSSTALGFLLLRLQPEGFQSESLKPHLKHQQKNVTFQRRVISEGLQTLFSPTCSNLFESSDQFFCKMPESFMFLVNGFQEMKVDGSLSKVKAIRFKGPWWLIPVRDYTPHQNNTAPGTLLKKGQKLQFLIQCYVKKSLCSWTHTCTHRVNMHVDVMSHTSTPADKANDFYLQED